MLQLSIPRALRSRFYRESEESDRLSGHKIGGLKGWSISTEDGISAFHALLGLLGISELLRTHLRSRPVSNWTPVSFTCPAAGKTILTTSVNQWVRAVRMSRVVTSLGWILRFKLGQYLLESYAPNRDYLLR